MIPFHPRTQINICVERRKLANMTNVQHQSVNDVYVISGEKGRRVECCRENSSRTGNEG